MVHIRLALFGAGAGAGAGLGAGLGASADDGAGAGAGFPLHEPKLNPFEAVTAGGCRPDHDWESVSHLPLCWQLSATSPQQ